MFENKNILITGASYGLGAFVAESLGEMGANIILVARNEKKLKSTFSKIPNESKSLIIPCDLEVNSEIKEMCEKVKNHFQNLDTIMHIAGGGLGVKDALPFHKDYMKVMNLNLFSIFEINRNLLSLLKKSEQSTIFHVGSIASNESVGSLSYNVAKVGLVAYVRSLSRELSGSRIIVNGIAPGAFECEGNAMSRLKNKNIMAYTEFIEQKIPSRKMPSASDLLPLILLLIGRNNHIYNGNIISCENGEGKFYKTI
jgi:NAD(P)-dependent dehydrogenase (short-subunit alcohol dehydrogenase family)